MGQKGSQQGRSRAEQDVERTENVGFGKDPQCVDQHAPEGETGDGGGRKDRQQGERLGNAQLHRSEDKGHKRQAQHKVERCNHRIDRHLPDSVVSHIRFSFRSVFLSQELATDCARLLPQVGCAPYYTPSGSGMQGRNPQKQQSDGEKKKRTGSCQTGGFHIIILWKESGETPKNNEKVREGHGIFAGRQCRKKNEKKTV